MHRAHLPISRRMAESIGHVGLLVGLLAGPVLAAENASAVPRYKFALGGRYVYAIKVEADLPESVETLSGNTTYTVKSVDAKTGQITLVNTGALVTKSKAKPSRQGFRPFPPRPSFPPMFGPGDFAPQRELTITPDGFLVRYQGESQLPYLLGNLSMLVLEPLPPGGKTTWETRRAVSIAEKEKNARPLPRFVGNQNQGTIHTSQEHAT